MFAVRIQSECLQGRFLQFLIVGVLLSGAGAGVTLGQPQDGAHLPGVASEFCQSKRTSWNADIRGLASLYCIGTGFTETSLHGAHATARPIFYGAVPGAWVGAALADNRRGAAAAYRLTLTQGLTYGATVGLKFAVLRPRPYVDWPLEARVRRHQGSGGRDRRLSFPSGHASLSVALATSWSLSYPHWYVIAPGALWATGVTLSRVYLGVHYPSDVLAGAALGAGVAILVHELRDLLTPSMLKPDGDKGPTPAVPISIRLRF